MGKVIGDSGQFELWLREFLPQLFDENFELAPGEVIDRQVSPIIGDNGFYLESALTLVFSELNFLLLTAFRKAV